MTSNSKIEGRRSFLKMLGLAPVVGGAALAGAATAPATPLTFKDWRGFNIRVGSSSEPDTMLVHWSDPDTREWETKVTNRAGSCLLPGRASGATICADGNSVVVSTPTDKWVMTYIGFPLVWAFTRA